MSITVTAPVASAVKCQRNRSSSLLNMTHLVRVNEFDRLASALSSLVQIVDEHPDLADQAAALLESAAELIREHRAPGSMPSAEQRQWEAVGARFADDHTVERATLRTRTAVADLKASSLRSDAEVAARLRVDRTRVSQRVAERSLYAVHDDNGRWFPSWQFDGDRTLPHLKAVLTALDSDLHPLTVSHWFLTSDAELDLDDEATSPREWLLTGGKPGRVVGLVPQP